ncbi:MAG: hypothetical protein QXV37_01220 [Candidatus Jordarchaeaceae archaeon]
MVLKGEEIINSAIDASKLIDRTLNQVKSILEEKEAEIGRLRTEVENLNKKLTEQKQEKERSEEELKKLEKENVEVKRELQEIKDQLLKISAMYSELSKKKEEAINVKELLTIYVTLLEEVFAGMPHAKILWLLHGAKNVLTRDELTKTSGFQPAIVLKSIHDLNNSKLVQYDMNTQNVKLLRKLY